MSARNAQQPEAHVGEDSGFCDRVKAAGGAIAVDTSVVAGHVVTRYLTPQDLRDAVRKRLDATVQLCGLEEA